MTRVQRFDAMRAGRVAGLSGQPAVCPYPPTGATAGMATVWTRAYLDHHQTAKDAVNYTG